MANENNYVLCPICNMDCTHLVGVRALPDHRQESHALRFHGECGHVWEVWYRQHKGNTIVETIPVRCRHTRCGKPAKHIMCIDDHDGNAGAYYVQDYCSLECFICDLDHAVHDDRDVEELIRQTISS